VMEKHRRILVIDDDPEIWKAYEAILSDKNQYFTESGRRLTEFMDPQESEADAVAEDAFDVSYALRGEEGIRQVEQSLDAGRPFAVAFIDIRMPPGMDGLETALTIRRMDPQIEFVLVTAYSDRSREEISREIGIPGKMLYLRKPFDPDELTQIAVSLTEKWRISRQEQICRKQFEALFDMVPAAIFSLDGKACVTAWNPEAELITGYGADEVIGKECFIRQIAVQLPCAPPCGGCCIHKDCCPADRCMEMDILDKHGRKRTIYKCHTCLTDHKGNIDKVVGSFWDMTAVKETQANLKISRERYRMLVESLNDWVWESDADGRLTYSSPMCSKIYGYRSDELVGLSLETVIAPSHIDAFRQMLRQCVETKTGFHGVERKGLKKSGHSIYIEAGAEPVVDEAGNVKGFCGIDRDITARRETELERLKIMDIQRRRQKMEALGTLAGGIAHDLNNMLTPIMGHAQLAIMNINSESPIQEKLRKIVVNTEKAAGLIRQILAFSRNQAMKKKSVNLNGLIAGFNDLMRRLIPEDIQMVLDLSKDVWPVEADPGQIEQVLINLVVNARDAVDHHGAIEIQTRNRQVPDGSLRDIENKSMAGDFVVLTVRDNGIGMDVADQDRIFDPFYTKKKDGKGTGLGLSVIYGIVKQHNGHIRLESEFGHGAAFHIYFRKASKLSEHGPVIPCAESPPDGKETVLLVEDNNDVRGAVSDALTHYGYRVVETVNGSDALEAFERIGHTVDVVLTDVIMPEVGGREVAQAVRKRNPGLPIVFMTGHPMDLNENDIMEDHITAIVHKPFKPKDITEKIRSLLDNLSRGDGDDS